MFNNSYLHLGLLLFAANNNVIPFMNYKDFLIPGEQIFLHKTFAEKDSLPYPSWQSKIEPYRVSQSSILNDNMYAQKQENLDLDGTNNVKRLTGLAEQYLMSDDYASALTAYKKALDISRKLGNRTASVEIVLVLDTIYEKQGNLGEAIELLKETLIAERTINDLSSHLSGISLSLRLADKYEAVGDILTSIEYIEGGLTLAKKIGNQRIESVFLSRVCASYLQLKKYDKAIEYANQALEIAQTLKDNSSELAALSMLSIANFQAGQSSDSIKSAKELIEKAEKFKHYGADQLASQILSFSYLKNSDNKNALIYAFKALKSAEEKQDFDGKITALNVLAATYRLTGDFPKAATYHQSAVKISQETKNLPREEESLSSMGETLYMSGQLVDAEKSLFSSLDIKEKLRKDSGSQENKISLFDIQQDSYKTLQKVLVAQKKTSLALEVAERGRARILVELLSAKFSGQSGPQVPLPSNSAQIQQSAKEHDSTIVEYSIVDNKILYIWVVQPSGVISHRQVLLPQQSSLASLVSGSRESIGVGGRNFKIEITTANSTDYLKQLYQLLISPITDLLPSDPNAQVIFVPHGELFLVPFPALQNTKGQYLIEKHTILTAPAIQVLDFTRQKRQQVNQVDLKDVVIVGNPTMPQLKLGKVSEQLKALPGAEREAIRIADLFKTKAWVGSQATKVTILSKLPQARIIHLATHGLLDDLKGLGTPGAIALAPSVIGEPNDGLLTANEILDLKLNAELVVLSACDTGRGKITSDSVIGLSRSLILAGSSSVMVSLWSVPDAPTAELMTEFYQNWQERKLDKAQALRQAMLTIMKRPGVTPKDWAAFTLIGESK
jgi:CHAT domain-containing protein